MIQVPCAALRPLCSAPRGDLLKGRTARCSDYHATCCCSADQAQQPPTFREHGWCDACGRAAVDQIRRLRPISPGLAAQHRRLCLCLCLPVPMIVPQESEAHWEQAEVGPAGCVGRVLRARAHSRDRRASHPSRRSAVRGVLRGNSASLPVAARHDTAWRPGAEMCWPSAHQSLSFSHIIYVTVVTIVTFVLTDYIQQHIIYHSFHNCILIKVCILII